MIKKNKTKIKRNWLLWISYRVNSYCVLLCWAIIVYVSNRVLYSIIGMTELYKVWDWDISKTAHHSFQHIKRNYLGLQKRQAVTISCMLLFAFIVHVSTMWCAIGLRTGWLNHIHVWLRHWNKTVITVILDVSNKSLSVKRTLKQKKR